MNYLTAAPPPPATSNDPPKGSLSINNLNHKFCTLLQMRVCCLLVAHCG
jgi:hypothetical protein